MKKARTWKFLLHLLIVFISLAGCSISGTMENEGNRDIEISPAHYTEPGRCQDIPQGGFEVSDSIKHSHILYSVPSEEIFELYSSADNTSSQIWVYTVDDGSHNLIMENQTKTFLMFGFLNDGYHFAVMDQDDLLLTDIDGVVPERLDLSITDNFQVIDDIYPYSYFWRVMHEVDLSVSPDGKKKANWELGDPTFDIIDISTGEAETILNYDNRGYISGNWSPDSSQYVAIYTRPFPEELSKLYLIDVKDYHVEEIARYQGVSVSYPSWSSDGEKIVYKVLDRMNFSPTYFHVYDLSTGEIGEFAVEQEEGTNLHFGDENRILWSPDNQWILFFTKDYDYENQVWIIDIETINIETSEHYCITRGNSLNEEVVEWR